MDREGIDIGVLFATVVSSFCALQSVDFEVAMIRAYHRWLADYCSAYPTRLKGVAVVPMRAPERAAEEIRRVAKEPWAVGIYLSSHMEDKLLDHPGFHPIWQACVDTDLPACFHGGTARPPYGLGTFEMGNNLFIQHSATNPFEVMRGIASFVGGGVLDIFPTLRAAFLEAGVGWLPFWMERLDEHYELMPEYVPFLHRKPSEVIRSENFFISCDPDEETLPFVVNSVGAEHILYASDYPHFDGRFPETVSLTAGRNEFSADVRRKILHENPTRLYTRLK
jgi:predicted TIM-barrel fold metal-dependent hydrolase